MAKHVIPMVKKSATSAKSVTKATPAKPTKTTGRPTKRTPSAQERILAAIRLGATYDLAAKAGGISYETFNLWRNDDLQFLQALNDAEADACQRWLQAIDAAASDGAWQAAAWKLERRYPKDYGRTVQEHTGGQDIRISISRRDTPSGERRERGGDDGN